MLHDFDHGGRPIAAVPYLAKYRLYLRLLARNVHPLAIQTVKQAFHVELHAGIVTTSWVPGADWWGTAYQPLFDTVNDVTEAAKFFWPCRVRLCARTVPRDRRGLGVRTL